MATSDADKPPAPPRQSLTDELLRDGRTPEQVRNDDLTRQALRDRIRERVRAQQQPVPVPAKPTRTYDEARAGKRGVDYFPDDRCTICGAITWFDGVTYQRNHNPDAHGVEATTDNTMPAHRARGKTESAATVMDRMDSIRTAGVRRSMGERDDDD